MTLLGFNANCLFQQHNSDFRNLLEMLHWPESSSAPHTISSSPSLPLPFIAGGISFPPCCTLLEGPKQLSQRLSPIWVSLLVSCGLIQVTCLFFAELVRNITQFIIAGNTCRLVLLTMIWNFFSLLNGIPTEKSLFCFSQVIVLHLGIL